ncbi:OadG family protein [Rhodohalobacter sp. 614A]|uniref:OadG family protein n=1 Tax=Rhodohalobacter sp. 614A TaxID=2908649 RepID=UPI001F224F8C|nr:OadG family protein [Rhodohalobacter sp. 614A]
MFFDRLTEFDLSLVTMEEIGIMLIGYMIVFLVLALLYVVFQNIPRILALSSSAKKAFLKSKKSLIEAAEEAVGNGQKKPVEPKQTTDEPISGELNAAITAAIHLYVNENYHDEESAILTIQQESRRYSPWSSKIYSVTNLRR